MMWYSLVCGWGHGGGKIHEDLVVLEKDYEEAMGIKLAKDGCENDDEEY